MRQSGAQTRIKDASGASLAMYSTVAKSSFVFEVLSKSQPVSGKQVGY